MRVICSRSPAGRLQCRRLDAGGTRVADQFVKADRHSLPKVHGRSGGAESVTASGNAPGLRWKARISPIQTTARPAKCQMSADDAGAIFEPPERVLQIAMSHGGPCRLPACNRLWPGGELLNSRAWPAAGAAPTAERASRKATWYGFTTRRSANRKLAMARAAAPMFSGVARGNENYGGEVSAGLRSLLPCDCGIAAAAHAYFSSTFSPAEWMMARRFIRISPFPPDRDRYPARAHRGSPGSRLSRAASVW